MGMQMSRGPVRLLSSPIAGAGELAAARVPGLSDKEALGLLLAGEEEEELPLVAFELDGNDDAFLDPDPDLDSADARAVARRREVDSEAILIFLARYLKSGGGHDRTGDACFGYGSSGEDAPRGRTSSRRDGRLVGGRGVEAGSSDCVWPSGVSSSETGSAISWSSHSLPSCCRLASTVPGRTSYSSISSSKVSSVLFAVVRTPSSFRSLRRTPRTNHSQGWHSIRMPALS